MGGKYKKGDTGPAYMDCSWYVYTLFYNTGHLVSYTTAKEMAAGKAGWGKILHDVKIFDVEDLDVIWWTFTENRPDGHVGMTLYDPKSGLNMITHASESHGRVVLVPPSGTLIKDISKVKRLNE